MTERSIPKQIELDTFGVGGANTAISYLYRDADNYKQSRTVVLEGALTLDQAVAVVEALDESQWFVPSQIDLDDLQGSFVAGGEWDEQSDHPFHELIGIALTDNQPFGDMSAQAFHARFIAADWKLGEARVMAEHA